MRRALLPFCAAFALLAGVARPADALLHAGDPAFNWTKIELGTGTSHSQGDYLGKVVVLFLLGYD
jgi:hypothetical protein